MRLLFAFLTFFVLAGRASAVDLPRRPSFGAALTQAIADDVRARAKLATGEGLLIVKVLPGLSAQAAGLNDGDVILAIDGKKVSATAQLIAIVRAHRVGDSVPVLFARGSERQTAMLQLKGLPFETASDLDIAYDAVAAGQSLRRTIVTRPKATGRHPGILMIGGIGCYSFDAPLNDQDAYRQLLHGLSRQGFVTMRVEKSGIGDSTGLPCAEADLQTEVDGYVAGLRALKKRDDVDPTRVFILGHSIGGVAGPLVALQEPVRGLMVMETLGLTWFEYELINTRRQLKLGGATPAEIGEQMQNKAWCSYRLLLERTPRADILKARPQCADFMQYPASDRYVQQVAQQNLAGLWAKLKGAKVGVIYGAADFVTGVEESKALVEAVNAVSPGDGTYIEIADMDHYLIQTPDQAASLQRINTNGAGTFHPKLVGIVSDWFKNATR